MLFIIRILCLLVCFHNKENRINGLEKVSLILYSSPEIKVI